MKFTATAPRTAAVREQDAPWCRCCGTAEMAEGVFIARVTRGGRVTTPVLCLACGVLAEDAGLTVVLLPDFEQLAAGQDWYVAGVGVN